MERKGSAVWLNRHQHQARRVANGRGLVLGIMELRDKGAGRLFLWIISGGKVEKGGQKLSLSQAGGLTSKLRFEG